MTSTLEMDADISEAWENLKKEYEVGLIYNEKSLKDLIYYPIITDTTVCISTIVEKSYSRKCWAHVQKIMKKDNPNLFYIINPTLTEKINEKIREADFLKEKKKILKKENENEFQKGQYKEIKFYLGFIGFFLFLIFCKLFGLFE